MARREIQFLPENFYHIYNRGNNQEIIFTENENYNYFLKRLHDYFDPAKIDLLAYCLMPNHFHLLISPQKEINFSNIMRALSISYVKAFNKWRRRVGHVFQGDFQGRLIDKEGYLSHLCRYVHLNPVKANIAAQPEEWGYSDYREWISECELHAPNRRLRNELFGSGKEYQRFVMDFAGEQRMQKELEKILFG